MDNKLEQLLYAAIGSFISLRDKIDLSSEELKARQQQAEQAGKQWLDNLSERGDEEKQRVKNSLKTLLKEVIDELGLATKEDLQRLRKDLES